MPYIQSSDARLYYEQHGSGPAIMLIHGSGGHHMAWYRQTDYLSRFFTVLTPDLRGFGNSSAVEGGPDILDFPGDLLAILDDAGIDRTAILGQSIGALPALRLAIEHPERVSGVILAHSLGGLSDPAIKEMALANRAEAEKLPVMDRLLTPEFRQSRPELAFLFKQMGTFNNAGMMDLRNLSTEGPLAADILQRKVRLYFLCGERDAVLRPDTVNAAHAAVPGSTLTIVPNGPHSLYWEMPEVFNSVLHGYLNDIYGTR